MERLCNSLIIVLLYTFSSLASPRIFSTNEIHGTVYHGVTTGSGGIRGIESIVDSLRTINDLLLDAGGFSAGGLYDRAISGKSIDSTRSEQVVAAMVEMEYSAVNIGDEELAHGKAALLRWIHAGLPLISANVEFADSRTAIKPFELVSNENPLFITGVTTVRPLDIIEDGIKIVPIVSSLRSILSHAPVNSQIVLLAHVTPNELEMVLDSFPEIDIVIRGHRSVSGNYVDTILQRPVVGIGFEGSYVAKVDFEKFQNIKITQIENHSEIQDGKVDTTMYPLDCYVMSGCPYGIEAIQEVLRIREKIGSSFEWRLWFSGVRIGDSLVSGLRAGSIQDEMEVLAIQHLYPSKFHDFLWLMTREGGSVNRATSEMKLDSIKISKWVQINGYSSLAMNYDRSERLGITSSPVVFIKNKMYEPALESERFLFDFCRNSNRSSLFCDTFGECLSHDDCESDSGKVGRCEMESTGKTTCHFSRDPAFNVLQILPDDSSYFDHNKMVATTNHLFPSAVIETIRLGSAKADSIIALYKPESLPFLLFDTMLSQMSNFDQVESGLEPCHGGFRFRENIMKGDFYFLRPRIAGEKFYFVEFDSPLYVTLQKEYPHLSILPFFTLNSLEKNESFMAISTEISRRGSILNPEQFYRRYFENISIEALVWSLENNQKVIQFDSAESFKIYHKKR